MGSCHPGENSKPLPQATTRGRKGGKAITQLRMKYFGWGREGESLTAAEEAFVLERIQQGLTALLTATSNRRGLRTSSLNHPSSIAQSTCFAAVLLDRTL